MDERRSFVRVGSHRVTLTQDKRRSVVHCKSFGYRPAGHKAMHMCPSIRFNLAMRRHRTLHDSEPFANLQAIIARAPQEAFKTTHGPGTDPRKRDTAPERFDKHCPYASGFPVINQKCRASAPNIDQVKAFGPNSRLIPFGLFGKLRESPGEGSKPVAKSPVLIQIVSAPDRLRWPCRCSQYVAGRPCTQCKAGPTLDVSRAWRRRRRWR